LLLGILSIDAVDFFAESLLEEILGIFIVDADEIGFLVCSS
jgi:hypothetical protein